MVQLGEQTELWVWRVLVVLVVVVRESGQVGIVEPVVYSLHRVGILEHMDTVIVVVMVIVVVVVVVVLELQVLTMVILVVTVVRENTL
jgi:hypothetical protein